MSSPAPRVAVIGARRVRQGLGPFVARELCTAGASVVAVVGTTDASAELAARSLSAELSRDVAAYTSIDRLVERERIDALAILTPHASHETFLAAAAGARLHVLCEKPLIYGGPDLAGRARSWVERFAARGLLLRECCQWPYVLPAYDALFDIEREAPPARFAMRLSPDQGGDAMLVDSLSHPLSVLQALAPGEAEVSDIDHAFARGTGDGDDRSTTRLIYRAGATHIHVTIELGQCRTQPRPAGLALDGRFAHREVRSPGYTIYLTDGERAVKVRDPLTCLVERFVADLRAALAGGPDGSSAPAGGQPATDIAIRMRIFEQVLEAARAAAGAPAPVG